MRGSGPAEFQELRTVPPALRLCFFAFTQGCQFRLALSLTGPPGPPQVDPEAKGWTTILLPDL